MMYPQIRCYHEGSEIPPHSFFILCKGCNAGKPSFKFWTNSFIAICSNEKYFNFFFWLIYGLHQSGKFKARHRGTAIPFINLKDVRDCIRDVAPPIYPDWSGFQEVLSSLEKCTKLKETLAQQIIATERLQHALLNAYFNEIKKSR